MNTRHWAQGSPVGRGERRFANRADAGRRLGEALKAYAGKSQVMVLGLPRGGVPVAAGVAQALGAPLDAFVVRKLGFPGHEELAMGAVASGGFRVLNRDVLRNGGVDDEQVEAETRRQRLEVEEREKAYRLGRAPPAVEGRIVILVDDGLATGASLRAAIQALRQARPARIVAAVPVASREGLEAANRDADEVVCLKAPPDFMAVGQWYDDFRQVSDDEVRAYLEAGTARRAAPDQD